MMNRSLALGLLIGLAAGSIGGALIARSKRAETPPAPPSPAPVPASTPVEPDAPNPEVASLRAENTELKTRLEARNIATEAAAEPPVAAEWKEKLDSLLKRGLDAYKGPDFQRMVEDLRKRGAKGIEALAEKLLKSENAGERFLAAALLEDLGDPAGIPALAQALQDDDDLLVRRMSSHAIALIKNEAGLPALRTAMTRDTDWGVRVNAAYGVAKLGQSDGLRVLEEAYRSTTTPAEFRLAVLGGLSDVAAPSSAPIFRAVLAESTEVSYLYLTISAVEKLKDASFIPELNRIQADARYSANIREMAKKTAEGLAR